jgi:hypothetical protein
MNNPQPWWLTMPTAEVAVTILPLFSHPPYSPCVSELDAMTGIVAWCRTGSARGSNYHKPQTLSFTDPDFRAVAEAIQILERAALLMRADWGTGEGGGHVGLTRLGMHALETNTVHQYLGLSDVPPTA